MLKIYWEAIKCPREPCLGSVFALGQKCYPRVRCDLPIVRDLPGTPSAQEAREGFAGPDTPQGGPRLTVPMSRGQSFAAPVPGVLKKTNNSNLVFLLHDCQLSNNASFVQRYDGMAEMTGLLLSVNSVSLLPCFLKCEKINVLDELKSTCLCNNIF